ncbi:hypothetical protein AB0D12_11785 [Streptomyces sp. NPDC048479]|uniref:hypothetical protein n=1 Tax=Streptomyces sp. NPDC048479 TaxID=3154725 RepID=UPI00342A9E80
MRTRAASFIAATGLLAGAFTGLNAASAEAAPSASIHAAEPAAASITWGSRGDIGGDGTVWAKENGEVIAEAHWQADPGGTANPKGDTLCASDYSGDGRSVRAEVSIPTTVSTKGLTAPAKRCVTKDVAEGKSLHINLCLVSSSGTICSPGLAVKA